MNDQLSFNKAVMNPLNLLTNVFLLLTAPEQTQSVSDTADATITHNNGSEPVCTIDDAQLESIRERVKKLLWKGTNSGYSDFPINRQSFVSKTISKLLNSQSICNALTRDLGATEENHNELREKFKGSCLKPKTALLHGISAARIATQAQCPEGYDWAESPVYNGATSCDNVIEAMGDDGIPATMYAVEMQAGEVQSYLSKLSIAPLYTRYSNSGPLECKSGANDSFHKIFIGAGLPTLNYVMREKDGSGWSSWQLRRSCTAENGSTYEADDMMFNFGLRIMASMDVDIDGHDKAYTLIIGSVAAAGNGAIAKLVPSWLPYQRVIGAEYAKKLLLEAKSRGWEIK
jgi:hypothetical protein